jgi:hypothetical protein
MAWRWGGVFGAGVRMAGAKSRGLVGGLSSQAGWLLWFVWFVSFIWLNKTYQIDQMNQTDQIDKTDQIDQMNKTGRGRSGLC